MFTGGRVAAPLQAVARRSSPVFAIANLLAVADVHRDFEAEANFFKLRFSPHGQVSYWRHCVSLARHG